MYIFSGLFITLCVISFQSLEDKIVKKMFLEYSSVSDELKKLPYIPDEYKPKYRIVGKSITASDDELKDNHRAHSATLIQKMALNITRGTN